MRAGSRLLPCYRHAEGSAENSDPGIYQLGALRYTPGAEGFFGMPLSWPHVGPARLDRPHRQPEWRPPNPDRPTATTALRTAYRAAGHHQATAIKPIAALRWPPSPQGNPQTDSETPTQPVAGEAWVPHPSDVGWAICASYSGTMSPSSSSSGPRYFSYLRQRLVDVV